MDLVQSVRVVPIAQRALGRELVGAPRRHVRLRAAALGATQALRRVRPVRQVRAVQLHVVVDRALVRLALEAAGLLGLAQRLPLPLGKHPRHAMLLAPPQLRGRQRAAEGRAQHAGGLALHQIRYLEHAAPRLPQQVEAGEPQVRHERLELVHPGPCAPQLRVPLHVRVAAAQLVVAHHGAAVGGQRVKQLHVVVRGARPAVQAHKRRLARGKPRLHVARNAKVRLPLAKGHVALAHLHVRTCGKIVRHVSPLTPSRRPPRTPARCHCSRQSCAAVARHAVACR